MSRRCRLVRFFTTQVPTALGAGKARRRSPQRFFAGVPPEGQETRRDGPPVAVDGVEVARPGETVPTLHGPTPRGACGPWSDGASGSGGRRASTCGHETRACASACARSADRSVSSSEKKEGAGVGRLRASIAGSLDESVFHSLCMNEKPWKAPPATILLTQFPQLWRPVWRCAKSLQIRVIGPCGHDAFSALRGARHAA